jgi:hypothetical protein
MGQDFTGAAQLPNYVNGRLLTAEDLATGQDTLRRRDQQIGRAAGRGVVSGLWVSHTATTVTIAAGLGINSGGEPVKVSAAVTLPLAFAPAESSSSLTGSFGCCTPSVGTGSTVLAVGCYLLTVLPACQTQGESPMASAAPSAGASGGCVAQWTAQGVQFKAIPLPLGTSVLGVDVNDGNRRNLLAHWCFGAPQLDSLGVAPFTFNPAYTGFDLLDPADLTCADVPLAVFYWNGQSLDFVDNWSARRRITVPDPVSSSFSVIVDDRRRADGEARFLQFEDQVAELLDAGRGGTVAAHTYFGLLPPVGFLPVSSRSLSVLFDGLTREAAVVERVDAQPAAPGGAEAQPAAPASTAPASPVSSDYAGVVRSFLTDSLDHLDAIRAGLAQASHSGFDISTFFEGFAEFGGFLDWEVADFALRQSWYNAPVSTALYDQKQLQAAEFVNRISAASMMVYLVRQNVAAVIASGAATGTNVSGLYVVFLKNYSWVNGARVPVRLVPSTVKSAVQAGMNPGRRFGIAGFGIAGP